MEYDLYTELQQLRAKLGEYIGEYRRCGIEARKEGSRVLHAQGGEDA